MQCVQSEKKEAAPSFTTTRVNPEGVTPVESVATGGHMLCDLTSPWAATSVQLDSWSKEQNGGTRDARKSPGGWVRVRVSAEGEVGAAAECAARGL